jgi:hypothetical protein
MADAAGVIAVAKVKGTVSEVFATLDTNSDGVLDGSELRALCIALGHYTEAELSDKNMGMLVQEIDSSPNPQVCSFVRSGCSCYLCCCSSEIVLSCDCDSRSLLLLLLLLLLPTNTPLSMPLLIQTFSIKSIFEPLNPSTTSQQTNTDQQGRVHDMVSQVGTAHPIKH